MTKHNTDSIQNRFTAYLVSAVMNKRINYMEKRKNMLQKETLLTEQEIKKYLNIERQYQNFFGEPQYAVLEDWEKFREFLLALGSDNLMKALNKLKDKEHKLLFARVFGEMTFEELGRKFGMKPKQAEMSYYYILRKLRKELEAKK
ncbi:MAG: sigma-70 family RNA polymerase sigma factor [Lachnospiraceae bacterium]|nr:sigma-70 family RNA polymerase sigma factor [Lachnospiraceae bacterium]